MPLTLHSPQEDGDPFQIKPMYPDVQECLNQMEQIRIDDPSEIQQFNKHFAIKDND